MINRDYATDYDLGHDGRELPFDLLTYWTDDPQGVT
jgi:hypothetical protein